MGARSKAWGVGKGGLLLRARRVFDVALEGWLGLICLDFKGLSSVGGP